MDSEGITLNIIDAEMCNCLKTKHSIYRQSVKENSNINSNININHNKYKNLHIIQADALKICS